MKRLFVVWAFIAGMMSACATIHTPTGVQRHLFFQRGIILMITHTCSDHGRLYQAGRGLVADVRGAEPANVPMVPVVFGDREIQMTFQSLDEAGRVRTVFVERFLIDDWSTTSQTWTISDSNWTGGGGRQSRCR